MFHALLEVPSPGARTSFSVSSLQMPTGKCEGGGERGTGILLGFPALQPWFSYPTRGAVSGSQRRPWALEPTACQRPRPASDRRAAGRSAGRSHPPTALAAALLLGPQSGRPELQAAAALGVSGRPDVGPGRRSRLRRGPEALPRAPAVPAAPAQPGRLLTRARGEAAPPGGLPLLTRRCLGPAPGPALPATAGVAPQGAGPALPAAGHLHFPSHLRLSCASGV